MAQVIHSADFSREAIGLLGTKLKQSFRKLSEKTKPWTRQEHQPVGEADLDVKAEIVEAVLDQLLLDVSAKRERDGGREEQAPPPARVAPRILQVLQAMSAAHLGVGLNGPADDLAFTGAKFSVRF